MLGASAPILDVRRISECVNRPNIKTVVSAGQLGLFVVSDKDFVYKAMKSLFTPPAEAATFH